MVNEKGMVSTLHEQKTNNPLHEIFQDGMVVHRAPIGHTYLRHKYPMVKKTNH